MNALGYILGLYALYWFRKLKLDIKYQKEIENWLLDTDRKKFAKKIDKRILAEVNGYLAGKETIDEFIARIFKKKDLQIEFLKI